MVRNCKIHLGILENEEGTEKKNGLHENEERSLRVLDIEQKD